MNAFSELLIILLIFGVICLFTFAESKKWYDKWPAIDDDEFMARCPSGTNRDVTLRVRRIVSEQTGIEYAHVYPDQSFVNDLDCC